MPARRSPATAFTRGRRLAAAIGAILLLGVFLCGTSVKAQTDLAAVAPWQLPPEVQSGNGMSRATPQTEYGDIDDARPSDTCDGRCDFAGGCDGGPCCSPCNGWFWFRGDYLM